MEVEIPGHVITLLVHPLPAQRCSGHVTCSPAADAAAWVAEEPMSLSSGSHPLLRPPTWGKSGGGGHALEEGCCSRTARCSLSDLGPR
jgi:hypothetical protein